MPSFLQRSTTSSLKAQNPVPGTLKAPLLTPAAFIESLDVDEGRLSQENLAAADAANKSASVSPVEATMSEGHSESFAASSSSPPILPPASGSGTSSETPVQSANNDLWKDLDAPGPSLSASLSVPLAVSSSSSPVQIPSPVQPESDELNHKVARNVFGTTRFLHFDDVYHQF